MKAGRYIALFVVLFVCMGATDGSVAPSSTDSAIGILREFGFPIFVSLWFMWRVEKRMDRFTDAIQNLLTAVTIMAKTVDGWHSTPTPTRASTLPPEAPR